MFKSGSTKLVKNLNQHHVLNLVRMNPRISARQISRETGLRMSTVLYTLHELKDRGLIQDIGHGESTFQGGKRPALWDLSSDYGVVLGMELIPHEIRLVLLDFSTRIIFKHIFTIKTGSQPEALVQKVVEIVEQVLNEQNIQRENVLGLGIGIPGLIDSVKGMIHYSYTFNLKEVPFIEMVQPHFHFPVEIGNDANVGALGIKWISRTELLVPNILYVTINQNFRGMGIGLILNHELYEGTHGCAGEVSSFMPLAKRRRFVAQAMEKYGENAGIIQRLKSQEPGIIPVVDVIDEAEKDDEAAKYILREIAKVTGNELVRLVDLFDPHIIVIGGDICGAEKYTKQIIQERVSGMGITFPERNIPVQFSPFGIYSVAMGSTALIYQQIFLPE